jgi:cytochrome c oxidase cbb3-type subunit IV
MLTWTFLSSVMTVVSLATFLGIVIWAWSGKRRQAFEEAANAPFALPDDDATQVRNARRGGRPS